MGKSYSYSIVVEQAGTLYMNDVEVPIPREVVATGSDPLGWALEQVRAIYASKFEEDQGSELNLSVRDRRPGGLVRRARFTHPDSGIDLATFLAPRQGRGAGATKPNRSESRGTPGNEQVEREQAGAEESPEVIPPEEPPADRNAPEPQKANARVEKHEEPLQAKKTRTERKQEQQKPENTSVRAPSATPRRAETYDEKVRNERGWKKLDRDKSNRPQVGSAENEGRSRSLGLLELGKKQKTRNIIAIVVVVVAVIVGFRVFNGGTAYEAVCVDQRTMTRTVTGVACENEADTNHRWWYTSNSGELPGPGDTVDTQTGTFDEPKGAKDSIEYHVENVSDEN